MKKKVIIYDAGLVSKAMTHNLSKDQAVTSININSEALIEFEKCTPKSKMG